MTNILLVSDLWKTLGCELAISPQGELTITFDIDDENKWLEIKPDGAVIEHEWIDGAGIITDKLVNLHEVLIQLIEANHD